MANAARACVNRATTRFILRSGGAAAKSSPTAPPSPNQSLAKHNRKPLQVIENKHQRPKSIASFCRFLAQAPCLSVHNSRIPPFLFDTNERPRKKANLFTTNKKTFLFDTLE